MGGRHRVHVVDLAAGGGPAMELAAVPGREAAVHVGRVVGDGLIALAQHLVGLVGPAAADGFDPRFGVGHLGEVGRRVGQRAVADDAGGWRGRGSGRRGRQRRACRAAAHQRQHQQGQGEASMLRAVLSKSKPCHEQFRLSSARDPERRGARHRRPLRGEPHLLRRPQLCRSCPRDGGRPDARAAVLLHEAGQRADAVRRDRALPDGDQELPLRDGAGAGDRRAGVQGHARGGARRDLGLCAGPGHDTPRPAGRGQGRRPALGHRQGLRPVRHPRRDRAGGRRGLYGARCDHAGRQWQHETAG
mmetsp:Transcript_37534/g.87595  ORF Transcript_37534/g.87595 Transcript_37534/m.87595 type:complete len:303 (-) Transcript_37534:509-1417(-)